MLKQSYNSRQKHLEKSHSSENILIYRTVASPKPVRSLEVANNTFGERGLRGRGAKARLPPLFPRGTGPG